jgi:hypothetical protein
MPTRKKCRLRFGSVLCFRSDQDWKLRIGIFPEDEEVLVGGFGFGGVALQSVGASRLQA